MNEKLNITPHPPTLTEDVLVHADNSFSMKIGGHSKLYLPLLCPVV